MLFAYTNLSHNCSGFWDVKYVIAEAPVKSLKASLVKPAAIFIYPPCTLAHAFSNKITQSSLPLLLLKAGDFEYFVHGTKSSKTTSYHIPFKHNANT